MKAKLIKTQKGYHLDTGKFDGIHLACYPHNVTKQRLSLKNCQAIERGYDLDELAHAEILYNDQKREWWKQGFQKCLELMRDKKFSEEDVKIAMLNAIQMSPYQGEQFRKDNDYHMATDIIQSLQQTEWDVEIVMECCGKEYPQFCDGTCENVKPLLDADGCLILKRL